ncbi:glycosyltransferase family 2 protein [Acetanaerobacterium elongatum]|uniref:Glycosyltransferase, GT2 family n=1 Tax=Acetanaerobacterium elongatum TaxID=258515 RepID=A0A1H0D9C6_9FIRM|nr:glycosyltransferase [Acetanaerobacterium elongatum]SDN66715.1 Glycosyltransferase, GT2 family [Acetanaerobacterium elongatum]
MSEDAMNPTSAGESPLVSVVVLAYNHLDYTRQCIESLFKYTTDVPYELITVNNGSTDGTEKYFNSLPHQKKLSFAENIGVDKAINQGFALAEGKYTLNLSNDIVVTPRWLKNLVACAESSGDIGMVVPVCGFSSNYQQVNLGYKTLDEMQVLAEEYNQSNPLLWEERIRLVTYTCLFRTAVQKAIGGFDEDFNPGAYDDDAISFRIRRMGYRLILATDTYVHHFGSVTFNAEYAKNNLGWRNRELFYQKFGVQSWTASLIDFYVVDLAERPYRENINILGIGSSCGATLLQIKNRLRRNGVQIASIYYLSEQESTLPELFTICEQCIYGAPHQVKELFGARRYDLIVVESATEYLTHAKAFYGSLCELLADGGRLITTATAGVLPIIMNTLSQNGLSAVQQTSGYYFAFERQ